MTPEELQEDITELFDIAICDSLDIDWRPMDAAVSCAKALLAEPKTLAAIARQDSEFVDLIAALQGAMNILGGAESNASGNPEFDYVGPRVAACRAALAKVQP